MRQSVHLNLDDAWASDVLGLPLCDARQWGPRLRYIARRHEVDAFYADIEPNLGDFVLYGSGDFHHLAGALIRRIKTAPFTLVSFDNHPDWDIRPPYWSCGGWAARTLRTGRVDNVSVWGCGNFELQMPACVFADRRALRNGTLEIHAWSERQTPASRRRFDCMTRQNWRERFETFARQTSGKPIYITVDLDCLDRDQADTNWENGLFTADDVGWAISLLRDRCEVVGGDVCGAWSHPVYARFGQHLAGKWDHPGLAPVDPALGRAKNLRSLQRIWPVLTGM